MLQVRRLMLTDIEGDFFLKNQLAFSGGCVWKVSLHQIHYQFDYRMKRPSQLAFQEMIFYPA